RLPPGLAGFRLSKPRPAADLDQPQRPGRDGSGSAARARLAVPAWNSRYRVRAPLVPGHRRTGPSVPLHRRGRRPERNAWLADADRDAGRSDWRGEGHAETNRRATRLADCRHRIAWRRSRRAAAARIGPAAGLRNRTALGIGAGRSDATNRRRTGAGRIRRAGWWRYQRWPLPCSRATGGR